MSGRPPKPRTGKPVKHTPTGFPLFFDKRKPRIVTADPWAFLTHLAVTTLSKSSAAIAAAYIDQGYEFFEAAQNPRFESRPLLYYYAFLNLAKASLLIRKVDLPADAKHGLSDPRANSRERLRFEGQLVRVPNRANNHSQIFPELLNLLGYGGRLPRDIRVLELLRFVPSVHRTYTRVENCDPSFLPVVAFEVLSDVGLVWARVRLSQRDRDVQQVLPALRARRNFRTALSQVESGVDHELWFETQAVIGRKRGVERAISVVAQKLGLIGIAALLTAQQGYRWYFVNASPRDQVPYLGAGYAAMFYLGSITRYKPDVYRKIISGRHAWVVEEFLATQPIQLLYCLASQLAGVDVVKPYAVIQ